MWRWAVDLALCAAGSILLLRTLHRALRSGGILLDNHPELEHARIQVRLDGKLHEVGIRDDTAYILDSQAGRAVIASLVREGLFARDREIVFDRVERSWP
jgi:hypothetical protein